MGVLIGVPAKQCVSRKWGEGQKFVIKDEVKRITNANNCPANQCYKGHPVFLKKKPCDSQDFIRRGRSIAPDSDVKKVAKTFLVGNNQFRKYIFEDGSVMVAPKGYLMTGAKNNGDAKQGINTVFCPKGESKENAGFIINANHINV